MLFHLYSKEEKLQGVYAFLGKALQQQQRGQARSGRLFDTSSLCKTATVAAAAPQPSEPGDSDSSKGKDENPKKDKKDPRDRDEASRTGSHPATHHPPCMT